MWPLLSFTLQAKGLLSNPLSVVFGHIHALIDFRCVSVLNSDNNEDTNTTGMCDDQFLLLRVQKSLQYESQFLHGNRLAEVRFLLCLSACLIKCSQRTVLDDRHRCWLPWRPQWATGWFWFSTSSTVCTSKCCQIRFLQKNTSNDH